MKKYAIAYSKTDKPCLLEDGHFTRPLIDVTRQEPNIKALQATAELLNEKEKKIDELEKEVEWLRWYTEELERHTSKETLERIEQFMKHHNSKYPWRELLRK